MKKLFSCLLLSSIGLPFVSSPAEEDTNYHVNNSDIIEIFKSTVSGSTTSFTKLTTFDRASKNFYQAIEQITKIIEQLEKTKTFLMKVQDNFRIANGKFLFLQT